MKFKLIQTSEIRVMHSLIWVSGEREQGRCTLGKVHLPYAKTLVWRNTSHFFKLKNTDKVRSEGSNDRGPSGLNTEQGPSMTMTMRGAPRVKNNWMCIEALAGALKGG